MSDSEAVQSLEAIDAVLEQAKEAARNREVVVADRKRKRILPRYEWVLIRKIEAKDKLYGNLVLTEGQARSSIGEVVATSIKVTDLPRGTLVLFTNFAQKLDELEDATGEKSLYLVRDEEVYAAIVDEE